MTDFAAIAIAQPPIPVSLTLDPILFNNIISTDSDFFGGRSAAADGHSHSNLPQFSAATLQFLQKLSPSLQKAALSAILKPKKHKTKKNTEAPDHANEQHITVTTKTATSPLPSSTISSSSTTSTFTSTTHRTNSRPVTAITTTPKQSKNSHFRTPPAFHWNVDDSSSSMSLENNFSKERHAYNSNALDDVNRMGQPISENRGDAGIVLLVAIFNLLAVVIYAAHRHVTNTPSLPPRVLDWQIQKVLDELVLRVHSSRGASQLLARALPGGISPVEFSGRSSGFTSKNSLQIMNSAKSLLIKLAATPTAASTTTLPVGIYRPMTSLYSKVLDDIKSFLADGGSFSNLENNFEGRSLSSKGEKITPTWLQIAYGATQLNAIQWDGVLRTLTILGQSRSLASSNAIAGALMNALVSTEGTGRSFTSFDINSLTNAAFESKENYLPKNVSEETKPDSFRNMRKIGFVEDAPALAGAGGELGDHWGQRWFSLVTRLAPVALDATTLYARAHGEPTCLRSLLCSINFSWKKVGSLQAALTPLLSLLTGWALEDRAPHPLGDSLSAIRGGWLGRDCAKVYPECAIKRGPQDIVGQALTYFSKLEISVNENPMENPDASLHSFNQYSNEATPSRIKTGQLRHDLDSSSTETRWQHAKVPPKQEPINKHDITKHELNNNDNSEKNDGYVGGGNRYTKEPVVKHHDGISGNVDLRNPFDALQPQHSDGDSKFPETKPLNSREDRFPSATERYSAQQSYEARNPHDSYEMYRKEVYGQYVPEHQQLKYTTDHRQHPRRGMEQQANLIRNHKMDVNDVDSGERDHQKNKNPHQYNMEGREPPSSSTEAWDAGYQHRQGDEHASSPPYERYDSPHKEEDVPLPNGSVIAGMALQDAPTSTTRTKKGEKVKPPFKSLKSSSSESNKPVPTQVRPFHHEQQHIHQPKQHHRQVQTQQQTGIKKITPMQESRVTKNSKQPIYRPQQSLQDNHKIYENHPNHKHRQRNNQEEFNSKKQFGKHAVKPDTLSKYGSQLSPATYQHTGKVQVPQHPPPPQYKRPKEPGHRNTGGKLPLVRSPHRPKSRILFQSRHPFIQQQEQRKKYWHSEETYPHLHRISISTHPSTKTHDSSNTITRSGEREYTNQRMNSKMPLKKGVSSSSLRSGIGNSKNDKLEIPLYTNIRQNRPRISSQRTSIGSSIETENRDSSPNMQRNRPKYRYGLRRGLPAVTVQNFSKTHQGTPSTSHLSKKPRPWYTYDQIYRKGKRRHKSEPSTSAPMSPVYEKHVEEFGPDDAITDELRNNLLYEYIRDQKKESHEE